MVSEIIDVSKCTEHIMYGQFHNLEEINDKIRNGVSFNNHLPGAIYIITKTANKNITCSVFNSNFNGFENYTGSRINLTNLLTKLPSKDRCIIYKMKMKQINKYVWYIPLHSNLYNEIIPYFISSEPLKIVNVYIYIFIPEISLNNITNIII